MGSEVKEWGVRVQRKKGSLRQSLVGTTAHFNAWRSLASKVRLRFVAGKRFCSYLTPLIRFPLRWPIQPAHGPAVSTGRQLKRQRPRARCSRYHPNGFGYGFELLRAGRCVAGQTGSKGPRCAVGELLSLKFVDCLRHPPGLRLVNPILCGPNNLGEFKAPS